MLRGGALLALLVLMVPGSVRADERLNKLVKSAERLYQGGKYRESADVLKEAYALEPNPRLLYNIARAYDQAGDLTEAVSFYQRYVGSPEGTDPQLLKRSALAIERLRGLIDKDLAGKKQKEADQAKAEADAKAAQARLEEARRAQLEAEAHNREVAQAVVRTRHKERVGAFVLGGVGVAAAGAGAVFGILANSSYSKFGSAQTVADKDSFESQTKTNALLADVGYGVGVAALVTAIILYPKGDEPQVSLVSVPNGAGLKVRF